MNQVGVNALFFADLTEIPNLTVQNDADSVAAVSGLLDFGGPAAITRFVVAVCVDAVKRQTVRALAHVGQEALEFGPRIANLDTASAIVFVFDSARILAAITHSIP